MVPIKPLIAHEVRQLLRDGRFWWVGSLVLVLLLSSGAFGLGHAAATKSERDEARETAASQWAAQGDKNPHAAAHYGIYVFKPLSGLSFLDPGVDPSLGVTVKLQAHKRSALVGASAQDSTAIRHFGRLTPAAILQLILPLLIIGLGFTAWSAERDRGTLRQLMSYGVEPSRLLWGKLLGLGATLSMLLLPAVVGGAVALSSMSDSTIAAGRVVGLFVSYLLYGVIFMCGSIWVSAKASTSRVALVVLLGFWGITSLIVPRFAGNFIDSVFPMPSASTFAAELEQSLKDGLPKHSGREARTDVLLKKIMKEEGFEGGGVMMMSGSLLQGLELEAEALFEREVFDHHFDALSRRSQTQQQALQWFGIVSPFVATRALSMGLAGTDLGHHQDFTQHAERYRRALVSQLNREFAESAGTDGWAYKANRQLWEKAPPFTYSQPGPGWLFERHLVAIMMLLFWTVLTGFGAWWSARHLKVV